MRSFWPHGINHGEVSMKIVSLDFYSGFFIEATI